MNDVETVPMTVENITIPQHDFRHDDKQGVPKDVCTACRVQFAFHPHRLAFMQKVVANQFGIDWKRATFTQRQGIKDEAMKIIGKQKSIKSVSPVRLTEKE